MPSIQNDWAAMAAAQRKKMVGKRGQDRLGVIPPSQSPWGWRRREAGAASPAGIKREQKQWDSMPMYLKDAPLKHDTSIEETVFALTGVPSMLRLAGIGVKAAGRAGTEALRSRGIGGWERVTDPGRRQFMKTTATGAAIAAGASVTENPLVQLAKKGIEKFNKEKIDKAVQAYKKLDEHITKGKDYWKGHDWYHDTKKHIFRPSSPLEDWDGSFTYMAGYKKGVGNPITGGGPNPVAEQILRAYREKNYGQELVKELDKYKEYLPGRYVTIKGTIQDIPRMAGRPYKPEPRSPDIVLDKFKAIARKEYRHAHWLHDIEDFSERHLERAIKRALMRSGKKSEYVEKGTGGKLRPGSDQQAILRDEWSKGLKKKWQHSATLRKRAAKAAREKPRKRK